MKETSKAVFSILALCLLGGVILLTMVLISPPAPSTDVPTTVFSAGQETQDLEIIARESQPMGISQAHTDVRDYLLGEIRELGLEPQVQDTFGVRIVCTLFAGGMATLAPREGPAATQAASSLALVATIMCLGSGNSCMSERSASKMISPISNLILGRSFVQSKFF